MKALITAELNVDLIRKTMTDIQFDVAGYCVNHEVMTSSELAEIISEYDILICEFEMVTKEVIEKADNLKYIVCCRGGVKSVVDVEAAKKRHILVSHNAGRNANAVSEIVMGYILDFCRNISRSDKLIHNRTITKASRDIPAEYKDSIWGFNNSSPYVALRGRSPRYMTLGIVGYGNIGQKIAEKASAFGMNIIVYDPMDAVMVNSEKVKNVGFEELLKTADIVTLHCPLTTSNHNMMGKVQFKLMKKDALFINTARGGLVDEHALDWALRNGEIAAAALDVCCQEPMPNDYFLLDTPNLLLTPHIAGASDEVIHKGTEMVIRKLMNYIGMDLVM